MEKFDRIADKVVVITGASSGIGEATARLLAYNGAKLILGARREDRLKQLADELTNNGGEVIYKATDVADRAQVSDLVNLAISTYGKVDVLFNNAGIMPLSYVESLHVEEWEKMIDINLKGVLYGVAAVLPTMLEKNEGQIITTGSVASYNSEPTGVIYSTTKFGVRALHEGLRKEMRGRVRLTLIAPGMTDTELGNDITEIASKESLMKNRKNSIKSEDVARSVAFAISQPEHVDTPVITVTQR